MNEFLAKLWHYPPIPLPLHYTRTVHGKPGQGDRTLIIKLKRDRATVRAVKEIEKMSITDFLDNFFKDCITDDLPGDVEKIWSTDYFYYWQGHYPGIYRMFKIFDIKKEGE